MVCRFKSDSGLHFKKGTTLDILADLRKNICEVTFIKANGNERTMICTLIPDYLPVTSDYDDTIQSKDLESDKVTVWDIEEDAWRSFKPSRVTNIVFSPE
ncbi:MAG: DUF2693 domain-containing protein [Hymenobacter sp.]|nr:MAG: DUF2693 domain-containing protein [Hymenobacter sp.]